MYQDKTGFTLIELLITMAVVGVLATVVVQNVSGAKAKAQEARTVASLRSAQQVATYCLDSKNNLNTPNIANVICAGQGNWPAPVGMGWEYADTALCTFDGDVSDGTFKYCATDGTKTISCTESGCLTLE